MFQSTKMLVLNLLFGAIILHHCCVTAIQYNDIIALTMNESFVNLSSSDFNASDHLETVDIKKIIISESTRNGDTLTPDFISFLDNPISESGKFEGDIELPPNSNISLSGSYWKEAFAAIVDRNRVWTNGIVPYLVSSNYGTYARMQIAGAIADLHKYTCLKFVARTNQIDYIIIKPKLGCASPIGRMGGDQYVSISAGCVEKPTIIHELMHAVGFYHEQNRYDRDEHVVVHWSNIKPYPGIIEQFQKRAKSILTVLDAPYDQHSIMHYGSNDFAKYPNLTTITANDNGSLSNNYGLTKLDIYKLNKLYHCPETPGTDQARTTTATTTATTTNTAVEPSTTGLLNVKKIEVELIQSQSLSSGTRQLRSKNNTRLFVCDDYQLSRNRFVDILEIDTSTLETKVALTMNGTNIASSICGFPCYDGFSIIDFDFLDTSSMYISLSWYNAFPFARIKRSHVLVKLDSTGKVDKFLVNPCAFDNDSPQTHFNSGQYLTVLSNGQIVFSCNQKLMFITLAADLTIIQMNYSNYDNTDVRSVYFTSLSSYGDNLVLFECYSRSVSVYSTETWDLQRTAIPPYRPRTYVIPVSECRMHLRYDGIMIGSNSIQDNMNVYHPNGSIALETNAKAEYVTSLGNYIYAIVKTSTGKRLHKYQFI